MKRNGLLTKSGATLLAIVLIVASAWGYVETVRSTSVKSIKVDRDVTYCNCHGVSLKMDIYYPNPVVAPVPAIVYVHGGSWYTGDKRSGAGQRDISALLARGNLVAAVNYRLAPSHKFPAQIEDVKCAIRFLRANAATYRLNPAGFGVFGDSAGGHLAALLGVTDVSAEFDNCCGCFKESSRVQAVVDMFGPAELTLTFERDRSPLLEHVFGTSDPECEIVRQASPVTHVSSDDPPFLIIHGEKDETVLPDQSAVLYGKLVSSNVPATLVLVKNCGHGFVPVGGPMSPTRTEITNLVADFFDRYLK